MKLIVYSRLYPPLTQINRISYYELNSPETERSGIKVINQFTVHMFILFILKFGAQTGAALPRSRAWFQTPVATTCKL